MSYSFEYEAAHAMLEMGLKIATMEYLLIALIRRTTENTSAKTHR